MKKLYEEFFHLEELLRTADSLINPMTVDQRLAWLMDKNVRGKLFEEYPKCFLKLNMGAKHMVLPVCNRSGMHDPQIIDISIKMANKIAGKPDIDTEELKVTLHKLEFLKNKYSKAIPKPSNAAGQKGNVTKNLNQISRLLKSNG